MDKAHPRITASSLPCPAWELVSFRGFSLLEGRQEQWYADEPSPWHCTILASFQYEPIENKAAGNDIDFFFALRTNDLQDPRSVFFVITDVSDAAERLAHIRATGIKASLFAIPANMDNLKRIIEFTTGLLKPCDSWLLWVGGIGLKATQGAPAGLKIPGSSKLLVGQTLYHWMTDNVQSSDVFLRVALDVCFSGLTLGLPWVYDARKTLKETWLPSGHAVVNRNTPHIVCASASGDNQRAYMVETFKKDAEMVQGKGTMRGSLLWGMADFLADQGGACFAADIPEGMVPLFSTAEGPQHAVVSTSHQDFVPKFWLSDTEYRNSPERHL